MGIESCDGWNELSDDSEKNVHKGWCMTNFEKDGETHERKEYCLERQHFLTYTIDLHLDCNK